MERYTKIIDAVNEYYITNQNKGEYINNLEYVRKQVIDLFGRGAISESEFLTLNSKISNYMKKISKTCLLDDS
jgi:hypothetical protein